MLTVLTTHISQCCLLRDLIDTTMLFIASSATWRLLWFFVCGLHQHATQPASSDQMRHQVQPGWLLSQRCSTAASATSSEEISTTGTWGSTLLMGQYWFFFYSLSPGDCHRNIHCCSANYAEWKCCQLELEPFIFLPCAPHSAFLEAFF